MSFKQDCKLTCNYIKNNKIQFIIGFCLLVVFFTLIKGHPSSIYEKMTIKDKSSYLDWALLSISTTFYLLYCVIKSKMNAVEKSFKSLLVTSSGLLFTMYNLSIYSDYFPRIGSFWSDGSFQADGFLGSALFFLCIVSFVGIILDELITWFRSNKKNKDE